MLIRDFRLKVASGPPDVPRIFSVAVSTPASSSRRSERHERFTERCLRVWSRRPVGLEAHLLARRVEQHCCQTTARPVTDRLGAVLAKHHDRRLENAG